MVHTVLMKFSTYVVSTCVIAISLLVGCSKSVDPSDAVGHANSTNLQRVTNLYLAYQTENNWVGPQDETKFKEFITGLRATLLTRIGVDAANLDQVFVSDRDGQPFKIRYGVIGNAMGSTEPVIFESVGVGGMRKIGTLNMEQREVDEQEYESLWAGKAPLAPSSSTRR